MGMCNHKVVLVGIKVRCFNEFDGEEVDKVFEQEETSKEAAK